MYLSFLEFDISLIDRPTIVIVLAGQIIVVSVLFLLYRFYNYSIPALRKYFRKEKSVNKTGVNNNSDQPVKEGEVKAAIAMALYLHFNEMHDEESNVITIQRVSKTYSPWSSKIYNMRNFRK